MSSTTPAIVRLKRAIKIADQIQKLETELATLLGQTRDGARAMIALAAAAKEAAPKKTRKPYTFSPEARAKIAAAQKARWAKARQPN
ncbi:MAG: hypothetical protein JWO94_967 [Verrucomicrobiaceae bacterium]|nr:hypothetical protein [Verrucomicrobiaceae bacterium]